MNEQQALDYLLGFIDYSRTHLETIAPENFNLARMRDFLARFADPHRTYPSLHIAGTKGKGSVAAMCASVLHDADLRVGLYTSPHLHHFNERIQVDGQPIPGEALGEIVGRFPALVDDFPGLTAYELQTALAFLYFAERQVDIAVVEVGLGGRLDSTNVISPLASVITSISLDHMAVLGDTLEAIAAEKGGIIKPGVPVIVAPQTPAAFSTLEAIARERDAPLHDVSKLVDVELLHEDLAGQRVRIIGCGRDLAATLALLGPHQRENAATAFAALCVLADNGFSIPDHAIQTGLQTVQWPGRFEVVSTDPPLVLDGAHNRDSARRLAESLEAYFPGQPRIYLFGASSDKDVAGMFAELLPDAQALLVVQSSHPRAMTALDLAALAAPFDVPVIPADNVPGALEDSLARAATEGAVLVATGSLYALAEMRAAWFARPPAP